MQRFKSNLNFYLVPPWPVIGLLQLAHLLAKSSPKQSAQYGLSSLLANFCPANWTLHLAHTKHSWNFKFKSNFHFISWEKRTDTLCHGSFLKVTPPDVRTFLHLTHLVAILSSKQETQNISFSLGIMKDLLPTYIW